MSQHAVWMPLGSVCLLRQRKQGVGMLNLSQNGNTIQWYLQGLFRGMVQEVALVIIKSINANTNEKPWLSTTSIDAASVLNRFLLGLFIQVSRKR